MMRTDQAAQARPTDPIASAVLDGLCTGGQRRLPAWLFYDAVGSQLFEAITELAEYYPTRCERAIFAAHADAIIGAAGPAAAEVLELGAGTAAKTEVLLGAAARRGHRRYVPADVSGDALAVAVLRLARPPLAFDVQPIVGDHYAALATLEPAARLVLFIGSSLGNYEDAEAIALLRAIRTRLAPGGALLLGLDRTTSPELLLPAYDDPVGVTAAFNRNILARLDRELGASFDPRRFRHHVVWNAARSRIEMHLASIGAQRVDLGRLGTAIAFADGETIHTESSYKYTEAHVARLLGAAGLYSDRSWLDPDARFVVHLCRPMLA